MTRGGRCAARPGHSEPRYIGAPALIQLSTVAICAVVKHARGFVLVVEHMYGMRTPHRSRLVPLILLLMRLVLGLLATISFCVVQDFVAFWLTMRA